MCGIFGHTGANEARIEKSRAALHTLSHRGPNGWGDVLADSVYMGHRRLSILDLSDNGRQPMVCQKGTEDVALTVNGEIYNFPTLRDELEQNHSIRFTSHSDSEVLLHGYRVWGMAELLQRVDGMFALVLHDRRRKQIFLARDHVGIKPLYYGLRPNAAGDTELSWASELKALVAYYGRDTLNTDPTAVYDFLTYCYIPAPKTLYQQIYKLAPGQWLTFNTASGTQTLATHWRLEDTIATTTPPETLEEACQQVRQALSTSVKEQLVADVPVGFFLSGGIDSSITCLEARPHVQQMLTFSIGFDDPAVDETPYARKVAEQLGTHHIARMITHAEVNTNALQLRQLFDEPFGDTSAFPTLAVSKLAAERVVVVLTGDGGDELFGGYTRYDNWLLWLTPWTGFLWLLRRPISWLKNRRWPASWWGKKIRQLCSRLEFFSLCDPLEKHARMSGGLIRTDAAKQRWAKALGIPAGYDDYWYTRLFYRPALPPRSRFQYLDFHTYMHDLVLTKVDRTSMAQAIETRVPFLSKRTIAVAWSIPERFRYHRGWLKGILKVAYQGQLPASTLFRRKQGFSLGRTQHGDALHLNQQTLPELILERWFPEVVTTP
jgi:asparagine synthase (glutamine-hydrolysing)